jgi:hypothetical protein
VTVSGSSSESCASVTTSAVISLVIDAIGSTACGFLLNSTSSVSWSTTSATLDFSVQFVVRGTQARELAERGHDGGAARMATRRSVRLPGHLGSRGRP